MQKILVVDDEADISELVQSLLEPEYEVFLAHNGEEAMRIVHQEKPDLIITDVLMPKVSGLDLYKNLQKIKSEIPMIIMSGRPSMEEYFDSWSIILFVNKPFKTSELLAQVKKALAPKANASAPSAAKAKPSLKTSAPTPVVPDKRKTAPTFQKRCALIASPDEGILNVLNRYLDWKGFKAEVCLDSNEFIELAVKMKPAVIICQYSEDVDLFDTAAVYKQLSKREETCKIPFAVICLSDLKGEATKKIPADHVLAFEGLDELREQIDFYL